MNEIRVSSTLEVLLNSRIYALTKDTYWYKESNEYPTNINIIYDNKIYQVIQKVNKGENPETNPEKFELIPAKEILSENVITEQINESNKLIQELKSFDITQAIPRLEALENRNTETEDTETTEPADEYPEFVQPTGAHDAYQVGDKVTYNGKKYICKLENCVWSPDTYPAGWEEVVEVTEDNVEV